MMDAFNDENLLFEPFLPSPPNSQPCDPPEPFSDEDEILEDYLDGDTSDPTTGIGDDNRNISRPNKTMKDRDWVIEQVENMLEKVVDGLLAEDQHLMINLKTRSGLNRRQLHPARDVDPAPPVRNMEINYPGSNIQDMKRFTMVLRILELVHCCLINDTTMTKRDMFYRHPDLFGKQSVVDRYVDDIACTFGVARSMLNVTAAAKGLMAGNVVIKRPDGTSVSGLSEPEGILIPATFESETLDMACIQWVLIIEKEATFRSILSSASWKIFGTQGLIITAKGYPDLVSRKLVRRLSDKYPEIPMFAFVDLDPDGIHIMSTYKYGSLRLSHEDAPRTDAPGVNLPNLKWLGVQSHQIDRKPGNEGDTTTGELANVQGIRKLTDRDRKKAGHMLEWGVCGEHGREPEWRVELQRLLMLNIKAEMQILDEVPGGLISWLGIQLGVLQGGSADDEILF